MGQIAVEMAAKILSYLVTQEQFFTKSLAGPEIQVEADTQPSRRWHAWRSPEIKAQRFILLMSSIQPQE